MPAKEMVTVGCRIPQGLIIHHPADRKIQVKLDGPRLVVADGKQLSPNFATTEVDADFWNAWKSVYRDNAILTSSAVFEARNAQEASAKAKELQKEPTGFEQMKQSTMGVEKDVS